MSKSRAAESNTDADHDVSSGVASTDPEHDSGVSMSTSLAEKIENFKSELGVNDEFDIFGGGLAAADTPPSPVMAPSLEDMRDHAKTLAAHSKETKVKVKVDRSERFKNSQNQSFHAGTSTRGNALRTHRISIRTVQYNRDPISCLSLQM